MLLHTDSYYNYHYLFIFIYSFIESNDDVIYMNMNKREDTLFVVVAT